MKHGVLLALLPLLLMTLGRVPFASGENENGAAPAGRSDRPDPSTWRQEVPDDPPGPPAGGSESPAAPQVRGRFVSVQVNVNGLGNNIFGDAANEPSIAIDPTDPDKIAIGWRQFSTVNSNFREAGWAYSHDRGQTWTFPDVLEPYVFRSDPVLDANADGDMYYYSLSTVTSAEMFRSLNGGVSWQGPYPGRGGDKAWMAIDRTNGIGRGNIYVQWNRSFSCCSGDFTRSTNGGLTFMSPIDVPGNPYWGTLSVGPDGELYVAGVARTSGFLFARSSNAQNPSVTPYFEMISNLSLGGTVAFGGGPNPGGLLGQVWVATDHSDGPDRGNVYLLASVNPPGGDPLDIMFSRSSDGGMTWSAPLRVNDDPEDNGAWQWFGTMSVAPNGRIDAVWNDTRNTGTAHLSEVFYAFSTDGGLTWAENVPVTPVFDSYVGWPNQNKLGDYYDMISDNSSANLAYSATFNGEQDVYFLRIIGDCNDNGIPDDQDIAEGTSGDCNDNQVPDECEPDEDCNNNGVQDICDIAGETSADCNTNKVPDECEPDEDCNNNGVQDICDVAAGTSENCNGNEIPDECEPDCNGTGVPDDCDILGGTSQDCNDNWSPDECDLAEGTSADCNENDYPDECDIYGCGPPSGPCPGEGDCCDPAGNGTPGCACACCCIAICAIDPFCCATQWDHICADEAAVERDCFCSGPGPAQSSDCNTNGIPDECEPDEDCNHNGVQDICDIAAGTSTDCNDNLIPDDCEIDGDGDGVIDDCDNCPAVPNTDQVDADGDGKGNLCDVCPEDFYDDRDGDGVCDSNDECFRDPDKVDAGQCGCGVPDTDDDGDGVADCLDQCPGVDDAVFAPQCADQIPTVSEWGMVILALLLLTAGKIHFGRRGFPTA